jgi:hypothetical protein
MTLPRLTSELRAVALSINVLSLISYLIGFLIVFIGSKMRWGPVFAPLFLLPGLFFTGLGWLKFTGLLPVVGFDKALRRLIGALVVARALMLPLCALLVYLYFKWYVSLDRWILAAYIADIALGLAISYRLIKARPSSRGAP